MAARTRINTQFVTILLATLLTAGLIVGLLLWLQMRGDAGRQMRLGEEMLAEGDYETASRHFGRAVSRDPSNLQYLRTYENTVRMIRPETSDAARTYYGRLLAALRQEALYNSTDPESHLRFLDELHTSARIISLLAPPTSRRAQWEQLSIAASDMLASVPESDPKYVYGYLYRGMATARLRAIMNESDLDRADKDLQTFVEAYPQNDLGWATLAHSRHLIAEHSRTASSSRRASELRAKVEPTMQQAIEAVPDGPFMNLVYAQYLSQRLNERDSGVTEQQAVEAARRAVALVKQTDDSWLILEASQVALSHASEQERLAALDLYVDYVDRNPAAIAHTYFLAQLYYQLGENDDSADMAERVMASEPLQVSFISQMQLTLRRLAAGLLVDIEHRRYAQAAAEGRQPDLQPVKDARQRLTTFIADIDNDPQLIRADAKLALLQDDFEAAAGGFEQLIRDGAADVESHVLSAFALEQIGQIGLAHERISAALAMRRANPVLLQRKAQLEFRMGRYAEARETVTAFMGVAPDDPDGVALARAIDAALAGDDATLDDPIALALREAQQAMSDGQTETARATVEAALAQIDENDFRLLNAATRLAMAGGQTDDALAYVDRALAVDPDSRHFRQLRAMLVAGDPLDAARQYMESEYDDPAERAVLLLATYSALVQEHRASARRLAEAGDEAGAATSRDIVQRGEAAVESQLATATQVAPNHPLLIEFRFNRALQERDWSEAETVANRARDANADRCRGLIYRGRLEYERNRMEQAVRAFQQATEIIPYSTIPWRGLAMSYQRLGNMVEAQRAYEQAYRANPNDMVTVRSYLALLVQMGEHGRAVRIAQTAHRLLPNDRAMREAWMELEAETGDRGAVLQARRRILKENAEDRENAIRLALLLARTEPTAELITEPDGTRTYSARRWDQLPVLERRRLLDEQRSKWQQEAEEILADIERRDGQDLSLVSMKAMLLRLRGDVAGGEQVLRAYINADDGSPPDVNALLALGQYLVEAGRFNEAYAALTRAVDYQSERREADLALGRFLFDRNVFDGAIHHFERVMAAAPDHSVQMRIVEAHFNQGNIEEAERQLNAALADKPVDYLGSILRAMIAHRRSAQLAAAGRDAEAQAKADEYRLSLEMAERLMPTNPAPHVLRARGLQHDYQRTQQTAMLSDALTALARADAVRPNDPQTSLVRIEVLRMMNNTSAAVAEATRLVDSAPDNIQYRRLLVQIHTQVGNYNAAVNVVKQAIDRQPNMALWHELLGNVHAEAGNMKEATAAFHRAYELGESVPNLIRYVGTLMSLESPDYPSVLNMLRTVPEHVSAQPVLGASFAVALHKTGRTEPARQYVRQSYERQRELVREGTMPASEIGRWFQVLGPVFADQHPREIEQTLMELAGHDPNPWELLWIARYWSSLGAEGISRAAELLGQAIDRTEADEVQLRSLLQFELATYYLVTERYDEAATGYRRVLRTNPKHGPSLNNLAFILAQHLDDAAGARPYAEQSLELSPNDPAVLDTMGWVHFKLGNSAQAEDFLRRSLAINETALTQLHLAHVLYAQGEGESALTRLRRAAELRPDSQTQAEIDRLVDDIRTNRSRSR